MGVLEAYKKFFAVSALEAQAETDKERWAQAFREMLENEAFRSLLDKVQRISDEQIVVSHDVATMAGAIGRQNGIRDVLEIVHRETARARRILAETQAVGDDNAR